ncbi:MAG: hypothetical protein ACTHOH_00075 [Lysobacteraceae bacterium]
MFDSGVALALLLSACLACAGTAGAQDRVANVDASSTSTADAALEAAPRDPNLQQVFFASKLQSAKPVLRVDYDASGVPTAVTLDHASGDAALDAAILAWGRQLRLPAGRAGHGFVPFDFGRETEPPPPSPYAQNVMRLDFQGKVLKAPSLDPVMHVFGRTNLTRVSTDLVIDYNAAGDVVDARLIDPTLDGRLNKRLVAWAKRVQFKPGEGGTLRLPLRFERR